LALADRGHQVDGACRQVLGAAVAALKLEALGRVERSQVLEQNLVARALRRIKVDLADLEEREVTLAVLRGADQARDGIAGAKIKAPDLARADVDVIGSGQIRAVGRAQKPK